MKIKKQVKLLTSHHGLLETLAFGFGNHHERRIFLLGDVDDAERLDFFLF